jgi:hypothetical protein
MKFLLTLYGAAAIFTGTYFYQRHLFVTPGLYVVGTLVLGFGIWLFLKQWIIFQSTVKTYGKLIGWGEESSTPNPKFPRIYYYAQVAFETPDGSRHHVTSATGTRPKPKTPMGHPMPVRYHPENPDDARLDTFFDFWGPSTVISFTGALLIGCSFLHGGH